MREEDLKIEIERLKKEIQELKRKKSGNERILKALTWLNVGEVAAKACRYLVSAGKATVTAEGAALSSGGILSMAGAQPAIFLHPCSWILILMCGKKVILPR